MQKYITGKKVSNTIKTAKNVAEYVVSRLVDLGITHSFSVPGDFAFAIDHALINNPKLKNIVSANELNASYAADGYARVRGAAILSTTYAVGELCALNGIMGSKAENNIVFHLVGFPGDSTVANRKQAHHTLGDGNFNQFQPLSASAACVSAVITPDNARREMNRVICEAFKYRQPAYITIGLDANHHPVTDSTPEKYFEGIKSNPAQLAEAIALILDRLNPVKKVVVVPAIKLDRFHLTEQAIQLIEALDIPFVIMPHDKATISEHHPNYAGLYAGELSDPKTKNIVEGADLVLNLGDVLWSDFSTAGYTNHLDMKKVINLGLSFVQSQDKFISNVYLGELLKKLTKKVKPKHYATTYQRPTFKVLKVSNKPLTLSAFYGQLIGFLKNNDILVVETGSSSINMPKLPLPDGVKYHNQTLWGSIGWATPAALGTALASPKQRTILVTGEGSHQLTLNELGTMGRYQIAPILFCINNNGFMIERALEIDPTPSYDDLPQLNYAQLPAAFGCSQWLTFKVRTEQELADALVAARQHKNGVYIELITGELDYGSSLAFYNQHLKQLYG